MSRTPDTVHLLPSQPAIRALPTTGKDGVPRREFSESVAATLAAILRTLSEKLNGQISFGSGVDYEWSGNLDAQLIRWKFPAVANTQVEIEHDLGRVPWGYVVCGQDRAGDIYYSNLGGWSARRIYLKASAADLLARFMLF